MSELRRTPLYGEHQVHNARFVDFAGWEMPIQYEGIKAEHTAVRERVGLFDVSHMGELWVTGETACAEVDRLITNDLLSLPAGRALYTCCCSSDGGILDDLIVYKFETERILVVCNASNISKIRMHFQTELSPNTLRDESDATALLALQGPKAAATLEAIQAGLSALSRFRVTSAVVAGIECKIARTGYTGEDGFEFYCSTKDAAALWRRLLDAGAPYDAVPVGLAARDTLRLEAGLCLYGNDIDEQTSPLEAGLGWTVKFDAGDFVGRSALLGQRDLGVQRSLVGFEMLGRGIARHGYELLDDAGNRVGQCTSGSPSPTLGKSIGLGYVPTRLAAIGTQLLVDCRGRQVPAQVVPFPFYKRKQR